VVTADIVQGVQAWWGPMLAFAAGLISFVSPCVLPLVPGYLSFVTGQPVTASGRKEGPASVLPIGLFILGFSAVFTLVGGFTAATISGWLRSDPGQRVAGTVVLAFGLLILLYAFRSGVPWLYREERPFLSRVRPGPAGAFPLGMAFAVGWTPCIGPVLGAILTLAANQGSTGRSVLLLFSYSLGLGLPFLVVGLGIRRAMTGFRFFSRNYHWFAGASGAVMLSIGALLVVGAWTRLIAPLFDFINRFTPAL
jgi:cytochrome c-type biogenesis protein